MIDSVDQNTAEREIRDLVARYSDAVNRRDPDAWGQTWALRSEWRLLGIKTTGRSKIVAQWQKFMEQIPFVFQQPTFGLVDLGDAAADGATGRWYINEIARRPDRSSTTIGVYHDHYAREDGRWRFKLRRFDVLYTGSEELGGVVTPFPVDIDES